MRRGIQVKHARRLGFTLIEILVVIAVMAVMAAMLMPVLSRARESAQLARCMAHLREIGEACMMYMSDYNETFPVAFAYTDPGSYAHRAWPAGQAVGGQTAGAEVRDISLPYDFMRPLWKYTARSRRIWACPSSPKMWVPGRGDISDFQWFGNCYPMNLAFGAPPGVVPPTGSEGLIYTLAGVQTRPGLWAIGRRLSTVTRPSRIVMFGERGIHQYFWAGQEDPLYSRKFRNHDQTACRMPVCFVDGHVKYVLITGDHIENVNGEAVHTYGLWGKGWGLMESGWIAERPDLGLPASM